MKICSLCSFKLISIFFSQTEVNEVLIPLQYDGVNMYIRVPKRHEEAA